MKGQSSQKQKWISMQCCGTKLIKWLAEGEEKRGSHSSQALHSSTEMKSETKD